MIEKYTIQLNKKLKYCVKPQYWLKYNISYKTTLVVCSALYLHCYQQREFHYGEKSSA
jgi:hypothetical protein